MINPAAYTHTSVAVRDALLYCGLPAIEVHLTNPASREEFRKVSLVEDVVVGRICGFGGYGYTLALLGAAASPAAGRGSVGGLDHRVERLLAALRKRRMDAYLCVRLSNIRYLTGFTGSNAALVVSPAGAVLFTDGRYTEQARSEVRGAEVEVTPDPWSAAARRMRALRARRIGFESRHLSVDSFRAVSRGRADRFVPVPDLVATIRMRKEPGEILAMERATAIATASLLSVLASGVRGKTERDVAADLAREMIRRGAEGVSFPPIVADGPRSAMPHATPTGDGDRAGTARWSSISGPAGTGTAPTRR